LTITGTGGGQTHTTSIELVVQQTPTTELIIDNVNAVFTGSWPTTTTGAGTGLFYGASYRVNYAGTGLDTAKWSFNVPTAGQWQVYAMWRSGTNRATNAKYTVNYAGGSTVVTVNQQTNGGVWMNLGTFNFNTAAYSIVLNDNANGVVIADAIRLVYAGS
jgi:hypothetical protein